MYKITFQIENGDAVVIDANEDEILLDLAKKANVPIDAPCSGNVSCGKCKMKLIEGQVKSSLTRHLSQSEWDEGYRLACNSKVCGDLSVLVPDIASAYQSRMKISDLSSPDELKIFNDITQSIKDNKISFESDLFLVPVSLREPTIEDTMPDNERLQRAVSAYMNAGMLVYIPYDVIKRLPQTMRQLNFEFNCVCLKYKSLVTVIDILPSDKKDVYALAVDIGTTTVSAVLVNVLDGKIVAKGSTGNGQIRYGADVINRIIQQSKEGGIQKLQDAIVTETLLPLMNNLCKEVGISTDNIYEMSVAANSTMNHLFLGIPADNLRLEPFIPVYFDLDGLFGKDLSFLPICPNAAVYIAPNIGSYVGGDITSGTLASLIWTKEEYSLFIDLGTNGEIVFGNKEFMMSCACSAGPAFEGGDISCGMRATNGAIEKVKIDKESMEPSYSVIGKQKPVGICGSGIIDLIAELFCCGIINSKGKFVRTGKRIVTDKHGTSSYVVAFKEEAQDAIKDILLTEVDIDNFIRAKGAIFSAINVMLEKLEMDINTIESVYVAGGIGSGINMGNAVAIGMLPDVDINKYKYIGNSSLVGAYCMVCSHAARDKITHLADNMTYVELSNEATYMDKFVAACFLPHTDENLFPSVFARIKR